ncbi:MAG: glycerate kinase [Bacillota bacterium]|nr:glycerate kinase [Bacillota bacterium]
MKVVIAPDSYKESMSAMEAAVCIREGLKKVFPDAECSLVPMADGGEGTARCLMLSQQGNKISCTVSGPLGKKTETDFVWIEKNQTAVIEVARACGMMMISPEEKNPDIATSYGVGELILQALKKDCREIILTLGGTVSNDGGSGMLMALGGRLLDREGKPVSLGAGGLSQIETVDLTEPVRLLKDVKITVLCDVKNRLLGKEGATYIFGPQKGVTEESLERIEAGMEHYAEKITGAVGRDVASMKGAGAAGGIGFALFAVSDARFCSGADYVMEALCLEEKIKNCDFVITGEGSIDAQSLQGKVPVRVARIAQKYKKPVYVFAGRQKGSMELFYEAGITAVFSILRSLKSMEEVLEEAPENLRCTVENFARVLAAGQIKVED